MSPVHVAGSALGTQVRVRRGSCPKRSFEVAVLSREYDVSIKKKFKLFVMLWALKDQSFRTAENKLITEKWEKKVLTDE